MNAWDVRLRTDHAATFSVPRDTHWPWSCCMARGLVNGSELARDAQMVILGREGSEVFHRGEP
ncbi:MAG TPA: hypothetical protein VIQ48_12840 [Rhodanobacter sp.]